MSGVSRPPRRQRRHSHLDDRAEAAIDALFELDGAPPGLRSTSMSTPIGDEARETVARCVADFGSPPAEFASADGKGGSTGLLSELLGSHPGYGEASPNAAVALDPSQLSLPGAGAVSMSAFDNPAVSCSPKIAEFLERIVLPTPEGLRLMRESGLRRGYLDPALRGGGRKYASFLSKLAHHGLIEFWIEPGVCECGAFAVPKKDGSQRLVVDARPANLFFSTLRRLSCPVGLRFPPSDVILNLVSGAGASM